MYATLIVVALLAADPPPEDGYFQQTRWGMTRGQIQKFYPEARPDQTLSALDLNDRTRSVVSLFTVESKTFTFAPKDGLISVTLFFADQRNPAAAAKFKNSVLATLDAKYGKGSYVPMPQMNVGMSEWIAEKSLIKFAWFPADGGSGWSFSVTYVDRARMALFRQLNDEKVKANSL
ncbi:MAG: hypothetical protein ACLPJH_19675 [Myxococcaceae bacterium]